MLSPTVTTEETRTEFLKKVSGFVDFWENDARAGSRLERLEGLAYSMLYLISGTPVDSIVDISEGIHEHWGELRYGQEVCV